MLLRHSAFIFAQSRGVVVYIVEYIKRLFSALILDADVENSAIMSFTRTENATSVFFILFVFFWRRGVVFLFGFNLFHGE